MNTIENQTAARLPRMTYDHLLTVGKIVQFLKNEGQIAESLYRSSIEQINEVAETVCIENDIVLIRGDQFRTIPKDTPLGERSFEALQALCHWLLDQDPVFKHYFECA
jgi:5-methylcytosine-specific restriction endonuclease McrBC regulatory subunit McrC